MNNFTRKTFIFASVLALQAASITANMTWDEFHKSLTQFINNTQKHKAKARNLVTNANGTYYSEITYYSEVINIIQEGKEIRNNAASLKNALQNIEIAPNIIKEKIESPLDAEIKGVTNLITTLEEVLKEYDSNIEKQIEELNKDIAKTNNKLQSALAQSECENGQPFTNISTDLLNELKDELIALFKRLETIIQNAGIIQYNFTPEYVALKHKSGTILSILVELQKELEKRNAK